MSIPHIVSITYELNTNGVTTHHRRELNPLASEALTAIQDAVGILRDEVRMEPKLCIQNGEPTDTAWEL
ncbi:MAG: hypothetical protein AAF438_11445 [Pseudomonadota bacterium]